MLHTIKLNAKKPQDIQKAAELLRAGCLVAIPTETVYGLAADASNSLAVRKVFDAKQRPVGHPLIVHTADPERIHIWASEIPDIAWRLIDAYWPGPLTLLLRKKHNVSDFITGGHPGVALRMPAHPATLRTMELLGGDLVAPSANPYGRISPTSAEHVLSGLAGRMDAVLDGGDCQVGIESTILDLTGETPVIARPGQIGQSDIETVIGARLAGNQPARQAVPGSVKRHYQPVTLTIGIATNLFPERLAASAQADRKIGAIWWRSSPHKHGCESVRLSDKPSEYARMLYAAMHSMDQANLDQILIELPPEEPEWLAVHDRLGRACTV